MCAALLGLIAVCSTMTLSPCAGAGGLRRQPPRRERAARQVDVQIPVRRGFHARDAVDRADRRASSCAMILGAFRNRRASSNATVIDRSPMARVGRSFDDNRRLICLRNAERPRRARVECVLLAGMNGQDHRRSAIVLARLRHSLADVELPYDDGGCRHDRPRWQLHTSAVCSPHACTRPSAT